VIEAMKGTMGSPLKKLMRKYFPLRFAALAFLLPVVVMTMPCVAQQSATVDQGAALFAPATAPGAFAPASAETPLLVALPADEMSSSSAALPEDPSALVSEGANRSQTRSSSATNVSQGRPMAPIHMKNIPAGWTAQPLTVRDKVILGARHIVSPLALGGIVLSAGYSHLTNGQPNYGTNSEAFGKRLGATAIRDPTESLLTDAVFAPLLHEDPRYYVAGDQFGFVHRTIYAITRPLISRTDHGRPTINGALLLGYGASSGLSYTYYPKINQNARDTFATFGGSLAGAALDDFVTEFTDDLLIVIHLKKKD
jgi:hypothetical protein